jgi:hypothetical protein
MPAKRNASQWQDYTERYRFARGESQSQPASDYGLFTTAVPFPCEESECVAKVFIALLGYPPRERLREYRTGDIQSDVPSGRLSEFEIVGTSSPRTRPVISAKKTAVWGIRSRKIRRPQAVSAGEPEAQEPEADLPVFTVQRVVEFVVAIPDER